jgi:hypothetical protein
VGHTTSATFDIGSGSFAGSNADTSMPEREKSDRDVLKKKERTRGISFVNRKKSASSQSHELTSSAIAPSVQQQEAMFLAALQTWPLDEKGFETYCLNLRYDLTLLYLS